MAQYSYSQIRAGRSKEHFLLFKLHASLTSAPLAWLFHKCGVSANGVTILGIALGLPAAALNATGNYYCAIALFHVFFLLDCVDGTLARGTRTTSAAGAYLDDLAHYVFHGLFFISLGTGLALEGRAMCGVLAVAAGLGNTLNRAHGDLVKSGGQLGPAHGEVASKATLQRRVLDWILGSFDFPNILLFMTALTWRLTLLETYFAYCAVTNLSYLAYCGARHASWLAQSRPVGRALAGK
jgi:phosphatidylglycerophosphate synthase